MRKEPKPDDIELGKRIERVRVEFADNIDPQRFSKPLGVTRQAVVNWERGHGASRARLEKIAVEYGVSFDWLATGRGAPRGDALPDPEPLPAKAPDHLPKLERLWDLFDKARHADDLILGQIISFAELLLEPKSQPKDAVRKSRTTTTKHAS